MTAGLKVWSPALPVVNALAFGADPSGVADSLTAIQAAITSVATTGGTVTFPPGTYSLSGKLTVNNNNVTLQGVGGASILKLAASSNSNLLRVNTTSDVTGATRLSRFAMRDLYLDHQGQSQANQASGIEGCLIIHQVDSVRLDNVYVKDARNCAFNIRNSSNVRVRGCTADTVYFGLGANGFNLLGVSGGAGTTTDNVIDGCEVIGTTFTTVTDGAITTGTATLTSATAAFTAADVGKMVLVTGAGTASGLLTTYISARVDATTVTLGNNAGTSVSGATFRYGFNDVGIELGAVLSSRVSAIGNVVRGGNSGVISEGGSDGSSTYVSAIGNHVDGSANIALGFSEAGGGTTLKHELGVCQGNTVYNAQTAIALAGNNYSVTGNIVDRFLGTGVLVGGNDYSERGTVIANNVIKAATTATGHGIDVTKSGAFTNFITDLTIIGNEIDGNTGGSRGVSLVGKLRGVVVNSNQIRGWKNAGILITSTGGASPIDTTIVGNQIRNNNQAANSAGVNSVGIGLGAGDSFLIDGNRITDDQGSPTQTHALHWTSGVVKVLLVGNDLRGNLTGVVNNLGGADVNSQARENLGWAVPTLASTATVALVPGEVIKISGTADITSLTATLDNRIVVLRFTGTAATSGIVDGSNLKLASTFAYTPDDTITLYCDGTNWFELGRSAN